MVCLHIPFAHIIDIRQRSDRPGALGEGEGDAADEGGNVVFWNAPMTRSDTPTNDLVHLFEPVNESVDQNQLRANVADLGFSFISCNKLI